MPIKGVERDSCLCAQGQGAQGKRLEKEETASMLLLFTCLRVTINWLELLFL